MATVTPAAQVQVATTRRIFEVWKWAGVNEADDCERVLCAGHADKTVYFLSAGAFGGSLTFEVTPEPNTASDRYVTAKDALTGNAISGVAAEAAHTIMETCYAARPTAGAGVAGVDVYLVLSSVK